MTKTMTKKTRDMKIKTQKPKKSDYVSTSSGFLGFFFSFCTFSLQQQTNIN